MKRNIKPNTRFVGFSEYYHDAGLAIIEQDGTVSFASQAERYAGKKNAPLIPEEMWDFVHDDDWVSFYEDHDVKWSKMGGPRTLGGTARNEDHTALKPIPNSLTYDEHFLHHESHCAGAFYTRPWESSLDTVMVSVDGSGEIQTGCILDSNFNLIKEWIWPCSLGIIYGQVTRALGFMQLSDEYIVMGMSAYGEVLPELYQFMDIVYNTYESNSKKVRQRDELLAKGIPLAEQLGYGHLFYKRLIPYIKECAEKHRHFDVAKTVQQFYEDKIMIIMKEARKYGSKLVFSGGCAQNIVANSMIRDLFDDMHVSIAPSDAGSALGAAARSWALHTGKDRVIWTPYLGHNIDREINPREVVDYLMKNKVCGIANGRAEYGPRALGNRSLIADVRYDVKDTVNDIKRRERFRPFAPAILEEYAEEYFEGHMNEYMQYTCKAKHDYKSVIHVDGTARVQIVKKDCTSILRPILEEYYERTGVPMLLNTSLNIKNKPMVNTVSDAIEWEKNYNVKVF